MGWSRMEGVECNGVEWSEIGWDGMGGLEQDRKSCVGRGGMGWGGEMKWNCILQDEAG